MRETERSLYQNVPLMADFAPTLNWHADERMRR